MSNETLFYLCGGVLAASAVIVTFVGLKVPKFPGRAMPIVVIWFALFVGGATTFAVLHAQDEETAEAAELEEAGEKIEEAETESGGISGETEESEEEAEEAAEGLNEEESVGPTEGSQEKPKGGQGGAAASTTLNLAADPTALAFDKTALDAKAGKVTIDFDNPSAIEHNVVIEGDDRELAGFEPITEGEESVSTDLKPGTYTFFCSVPGHREAGMEGTLTVK